MKSYFSKWLVTTMFGLVVIVFTFTSVVGADYCKSKPKLAKMFTAAGKVYFGSDNSNHGGDRLFAFNLASKKLEHSIKLSKEFGKDTVPHVQLGVHFDPVLSCTQPESNFDFCEHSVVFADMVVLVGGGQAMVHSWQGGHFTPYSHTAELMAESQILPSIKSRLYASIYMLFGQVAGNEMIKFTGATYDQFTDALYLTATILQDAIVNDDSWGVGKHLLFRSSFYPNGLMQDAVVVSKFEEPIAGLIDFNGALYVLTESGSILSVVNDTVSDQSFDPSAFFGCDGGNKSPLMEQLVKPNREDRIDNPMGALSNIGSLLFPRFPEQLKYVDSSLLTGSTFITIVSVLTILLVLIVGVDCFIIYNLNKSTDEDDDDFGTRRGRSRASKSGSGSRRSGRSHRSKSGSRSSP